MRNSPTDKRGRVHTSLITVAVMKVPDCKELNIKESDCEFRFIRASSKGGQHANKTESGVVVKHIPTRIEAKSTSDRSQHENKAVALDVLKSRLYQLKQFESELQATKQRIKHGSGHRSDKIRTIRVNDNIVKCEISGKTKSLKEYLKGDLDFE